MTKEERRLNEARVRMDELLKDITEYKGYHVYAYPNEGYCVGDDPLFIEMLKQFRSARDAYTLYLGKKYKVT